MEEAVLDTVSHIGHSALVSRVIDDFGASNPDDVEERGGETFVAAERAGTPRLRVGT